jgi:Family of unknown function (DUF6364)
MKTRLTLSIDEDVLKKTKIFAKKHRKCLTKIVHEYFISLDVKPFLNKKQ